MPRSGAAARRRLQEAALELFEERGFDRTTSAEIAASAGVNERTFFRHFADKREVLFDGEAELSAVVLAAVVDAPGVPEGPGIFDILLAAFRVCARNLDDNRAFTEPRARVIAATPALRERELAKHAGLADAVAEGLRRRGVVDDLARLAAQTGWAAHRHAVRAWRADPGLDLDEVLVRTFDDLRGLASRGESPTGTSVRGDH